MKKMINPPITPDRAHELLTAHLKHPDLSITDLMGEDEQHVVRLAWMKNADGQMPLVAYLDNIAKQRFIRDSAPVMNLAVRM